MDDLNPDMKIPKRRRNPTKIPFGRGGEGSQIGESDSPDWPGPISKQESKEKTTSRESNTQVGAASGGPHHPEEEKPTTREAGEKAGGKSKAKSTPVTTSRKVSELRATWELAHEGIDVDCPMVWANRPSPKKGQEKGNLWAGRLAEVWPENDTKGLHAFLTWAVTRWKELMEGKEFNWMNATPPFPSIRFIYDHHDRLYGVWKGGTMEEWRTGPHAKKIRRLLTEGKDKEAEALMRSTSK